ncbi:glycoside hydrolase [Candidatus Woesearchaeota archaeon]|nr:glycoside hydrolase [Candidatus Woesearchaeota archaeon]
MKKKDTIYLVPHTHYDAIWVFTKEDYFYINIDLILKKAVDMLGTTKEYKFLVEQAYLLEEVEKRRIELFKKIKKYVKQRRIEIADGEYLMADTMLPQEETLIREIMFGKQYTKEKFGVDVKVMWQADSFGLNAQLPQIYRKSGYKYLAFRRGSPEKKPSEFLWEALDGTRIISHFMPLGYRAGLDMRKLDKSYEALKDSAVTSHVLMPCGSGVTMPQEETIDAVKNWNKTHKSRMKISTPYKFFKELEQSKRLPIRTGEMYSGRYSEVFPDVASSRIWIKQSLRKYENLLLCFERFSALLSILGGTYSEELRNCWEKILFLAFHDVIPGTGMDSVYEEVKQHRWFLNSQLNYLLPRVLNSILKHDAKNGRNGDVMVFNPLSWDVSNWVEAELNFEKGQVYRIEGLKSGDEEVEVEVTRFSRYDDDSFRSVRIAFVANVPALGYRIYRTIPKNPENSKGQFLRIRGNSIENKFFRVKFSPATGIIEVFKNGKSICRGNELVIEEEIGDLYYHRESFGTPIKTESGKGIKYGLFLVNNFWIDKSPLRRVINIEGEYYSLRWPYRLTDKLSPILWRHKFIKFKKKIIIYKDIPRIDFLTIVENKHPRIRLRAVFNTDIKSSKYTCESQFGAVDRKTNQYYTEPKGWVEKPCGVFPSLRWIDYSDGKKGLTVINKGNPENEIRDGNVYLTLLRSVDMLSSDGRMGPAIPVPDATEFKKYEFEYAIYPHEKDWKNAKSYKKGYEFNYELSAIQVSREKKYRARRSFLRAEPGNIIVSAIKKAENKKGIIVRFYEAKGKETNASLTFFKNPKSAKAVNLMEDYSREFSKKIELKDERIRLKVKPFEIVTLRVGL